MKVSREETEQTQVNRCPIGQTAPSLSFVPFWYASHACDFRPAGQQPPDPDRSVRDRTGRVRVGSRELISAEPPTPAVRKETLHGSLLVYALNPECSH
jgi:hypothetical protein